jgi:hypothetical protein
LIKGDMQVSAGARAKAESPIRTAGKATIPQKRQEARVINVSFKG